MRKDPVLLHMQRTAASYRSAGLVEKAEKLETVIESWGEPVVYRPDDDGRLEASDEVTTDDGEVLTTDDGDPLVADGPAYDPSEHTVAEVRDHLAKHPEQRDAVLEAERAGKARTSLLDY